MRHCKYCDAEVKGVGYGDEYIDYCTEGCGCVEGYTYDDNELTENNKKE